MENKIENKWQYVYLLKKTFFSNCFIFIILQFKFHLRVDSKHTMFMKYFLAIVFLKFAGCSVVLTHDIGQSMNFMETLVNVYEPREIDDRSSKVFIINISYINVLSIISLFRARSCFCWRYYYFISSLRIQQQPNQLSPSRYDSCSNMLEAIKELFSVSILSYSRIYVVTS